MDKIIVNLQPFVLKQRISVYRDNLCIQTVEVTQDRITDVVTGFSKQYDIKKIVLIGHEEYLSRLKNSILESNIYDENEGNVEIISRR